MVPVFKLAALMLVSLEPSPSNLVAWKVSPSIYTVERVTMASVVVYVPGVK